MSQPNQRPMDLDILGMCAIVPEGRISVETIRNDEHDRVDAQLASLTPAFRERLAANLGIASVATFGDECSANAGRDAARRALDQAELSPDRLGLIVDFSTYAADCPQIWSLAQEVQDSLRTSAFSLSVRGSGCAGLHTGLLVADAMLASNPGMDAALLVAADRAPDRGRSCLPISYMADAATAMVVARSGLRKQRVGRIRAVAVQQMGCFSRLLVAESAPPHMSIDGATFEKKLLPVHFVMLHRVLSRALTMAEWKTTELDTIVYPNTTELDRSGVARGFGFTGMQLPGPRPNDIGHAFANDLLINVASHVHRVGSESMTSSHGCQRTAWLAAGSGFTWGAATVELGREDAAG